MAITPGQTKCCFIRRYFYTGNHLDSGASFSNSLNPYLIAAQRSNEILVSTEYYKQREMHTVFLSVVTLLTLWRHLFLLAKTKYDL